MSKANIAPIFKGIPHKNFRENMIHFWIESEGKDVLPHYLDGKFENLCLLCDGSKILNFEYEINYDGSIDESQCFEVNDNNFVIPTEIIKICED